MKAHPADSAFSAAAVAASSVRAAQLVIAAVVLVRGVTAGEPATTREYRYLMGTSVAVEASGGDAAARHAAIGEAFAAIAEVDRLMSNYRDDSELSHINQGAAHEAVTASDPMLSVLTAARLVSERSHGAFDVTVGPLVALWGFHDRRPHLPTDAELAAVRPLVDYRNVVLDAAHHAVRFSRDGVAMDLGGIAKGFAVEIAADVLRRHGLSGLVDAGGNERLLGTPPGKTTWSVGVNNPDARDQLLGVIETGETSVSTSAAYSNFVTIDGRAYGHILDPRTMRPATASLSATVLSRDGTLADAVSTAAFVLGPAAGLALIDSFDGMSGMIAYRRPDGSVGLAISEKLKKSFRRARDS